jgi:hypothetical protein
MPVKVKLTSEEHDIIALKEVMDVLKSINGGFFEFSVQTNMSKNVNKKTASDPEDFFITDIPENEYLKESEFFETMNSFRSSKDFGKDSEILIFLTSRKISNNNFNGIDFENKNIFVDLNGWDTNFLKGSPSKYSVSYMTFISVFILYYFKDRAKAVSALHRIDKGCVLDYNQNKENVDLKILTARICPVCLDTMMDLIPDENLLAYFRAGLEKIRHDIVQGEYYNKIKPKPVKVLLNFARQKKTGYKITFEGIGDLHLDAAHLTVYLYFLQKGINVYLDHVYLDYHLILELYKTFDMYAKEAINEDKIEKLVQKICRVEKVGDKYKRKSNNVLSERFNGINTEITKVLGTFGLEQPYQIVKRNNSKHGVLKDIKLIDNTGLLAKIKSLVGNRTIELLEI